MVYISFITEYENYLEVFCICGLAFLQYNKGFFFSFHPPPYLKKYVP